MASPLAVNLSHPLANHPLNRGRVLWLLGVRPSAGGNVWHDLTRKTAGGVLTNGPGWTAGRTGGLSFRGDGTDDEAIVSTPAFTVGSGPVTVACSGFLASTTARGCWLKVGTTDIGVGIGVGNGTFDGAGARWTCLYENIRWIDAGAITTAGWHRLMMTVDAAGTTPIVYADGKSLGSFAGSAPIGFTAISRVGGYTSSGAANRHFAGPLDDASVWLRELSASEAWADYLAWSQGYPPGGPLNYLPRRRWPGAAPQVPPTRVFDVTGRDRVVFEVAGRDWVVFEVTGLEDE